MKLYGLLAAAAIGLAACAGADDQVVEAPPITVSNVEVSANLSAVTSRDAARYWGNLDNDLESAIAAEFIGQTSPGGLGIAVDIDELSLATFFQSAQGGQPDARLTGTVIVTDPGTGAASGAYTVSATARQAMEIMGVDAQRVQVIPATSDQFYSAVVSAFARGVVDVVRSGGELRPPS